MLHWRNSLFSSRSKFKQNHEMTCECEGNQNLTSGLHMLDKYNAVRIMTFNVYMCILRVQIMFTCVWVLACWKCKQRLCIPVYIIFWTGEKQFNYSKSLISFIFYFIYCYIWFISFRIVFSIWYISFIFLSRIFRKYFLWNVF